MGARLVRRGGERAFPLACALGSQGSRCTSPIRPPALLLITYLLGLTGSLLWGEAFLWPRMWVRVWFFAAEKND